MELLATTIVGLYFAALILIFCYTLLQVQLAWRYMRSKRCKEQCLAQELTHHPMVTVQLPVYNERYVINRLIDAVAAFDWPKERLEIQVLDDSTDDTSQIIAEKLEEPALAELQIEHIQRPSREGYKAGALAFGQERAQGEFIAIFDADFLPKPDFLTNTIPQFDQPKIGMVQTRWGHLNKQYSLLTRLQAFALDAHFTVEQKGRDLGNYFINFNGTAGVWRKACIDDAGGWQHDTLTEDLDLSYRAQLKGWQFKYLEDVISPAELPVAMSALKTQQYRWTKGAAETARKNLGRVLHSDLPFHKKLHGVSHLLNSTVFLLILLVSLLSVPLLWIKSSDPQFALIFQLGSFFITGLLLWMIFYYGSISRDPISAGTKIRKIATMFPAFLTVSMGFSLHNGIAVIKGLAGEVSPFVRTPKFNVVGASGGWKSNNYLISRISGITMMEFLLTFYFLGGMISAFVLGDFALLPFHLMLFLGFLYISGYSIYEAGARSR